MNNELNATLSAQEWDIIGNALGQRPFAEVAGLISKLQSQIQSQQQKQLVGEAPVENHNGPI